MSKAKELVEKYNIDERELDPTRKKNVDKFLKGLSKLSKDTGVLLPSGIKLFPQTEPVVSVKYTPQSSFTAFDMEAVRTIDGKSQKVTGLN